MLACPLTCAGLFAYIQIPRDVPPSLESGYRREFEEKTEYKEPESYVEVAAVAA